MIHKHVLLAVACTLSAIGFAPADVAVDNTQPPTPSATKTRLAPPFTGATPGAVLSHQEIGTDIRHARAWKVRYVAKDVNGVPTEVTGLVIAPKEKGENRKVLTWCHGTTGLGDAACPSAQPNPARELATYFDAPSTQQIDFGVPGLQGFIDDGYVVCATDYQGLGTPGQHQYMVNRTQARDAIYLVHAARTLADIGAGIKVGSAGWSQGGGAAAAVAELDPEDYGDLQVIGTVCMSPSSAAVILNSPRGGLAAVLSSGQAAAPDPHGVMMLAGVQAANPADLQLADVFTPLGVATIEEAWNIQPVHHLGNTLGRLQVLKGPILKSPPVNFDSWKNAITAGSAGMRKPVCPVLVCIDGFKGGTVQPVAWQAAYADKVRELGGSVEIKEYPTDDHFSLPQRCVPDARKWLNALF